MFLIIDYIYIFFFINSHCHYTLNFIAHYIVLCFIYCIAITFNSKFINKNGIEVSSVFTNFSN